MTFDDDSFYTIKSILKVIAVAVLKTCIYCVSILLSLF